MIRNLIKWTYQKRLPRCIKRKMITLLWLNGLLKNSHETDAMWKYKNGILNTLNDANMAEKRYWWYAYNNSCGFSWQKSLFLGAVQKGRHCKNGNFWTPLPLVSPLVTISGYTLPPCHWVNSDKLSLRIQVTKTIWGHFKNSNDTRNYDKSAKFLK